MSGSRPSTPDPSGRGGQLRGALLLLALLVGVVAGAAVDRFALPGPARPEPASTPAVTAAVPGVGPTRVERGVPIGYVHTPRGAAQAAGNYLAVLGGQLTLDPAALDAALAQVAEPSALARLQASAASSLRVEETLWGIRTAHQRGQPILLTQTPIAYRVDSYAGDLATVSVWFVTNVGVENRQRLVAFFGIGSATLVWLAGDWRLRSVDAGTQAADAVPAGLQTPTETGGVPTKLAGFTAYGD
jgi:hypothetical protein